jgi:phosphoglycolate phosphatase-like HAD superfamily hydrolase
MIDIAKYDFFIFDCDGVILNSNNLKTRAFAEALPNEPSDIVTDFVEYHKKYGGISRYEKFRYYYETMKNQVDSEQEIENALNNFTNIVSDGLIKCNYIPGVIEFIKKLYVKEKKLFIVSGSDEEELKGVFSKRMIFHYFEQIYGSPIDKIENTRKVIELISNGQSGVFLGDSKTDYDAAKKYKLDFIFVSAVSEWQNAQQLITDDRIIKDFKEINEY